MILQVVAQTMVSAPVNWGDIATWVTGAATIALFIVALIQIQNERNARMKREAADEIARERAQAELVSAWIMAQGFGEVWNAGQLRLDMVAWAVIQNQSTQPIYQVIVSIVAVPETGKGFYRGGPVPEDQVCIDVVPPGRGYAMVPAHYQGMFRRPGVEIAFQDGAGRSWIRTAMGTLSEIRETTVEHYHVDLPANWQSISVNPPTEEDLRRMPSEYPDSEADEPDS